MKDEEQMVRLTLLKEWIILKVQAGFSISIF